MATNAEAIAAALAASGIDRSFGLPGGEVVLLLDAFRKVGIEFYLTGHEASAAFMAEVTGQLSERPGVCVSTLGPGAMNLMLGVANARLDRGPVLVVTAQVPSAIESYFSHQRLPLSAIFGQICKASATVTGHDTGDLVRHCLAVATAPPPGPVHLALPSDLAAQPVETQRKPPEISGAAPVLSLRTVESSALVEIADAVRESRRPLLIVGVGCLPSDLPALRRFLDAVGMPFVVTPKAKGYVPEDASGFLGVISGMALDKAVLETLDHADLLFGVGFDAVECDKTWYVERRITNLSPYPTGEGRYAPVESVGRIGEQLEALMGQIPRKEWPAQLVAQRRAAVRPKPLESDQGVSPLEALRALRDLLPRDTAMTCDVGSHKYFVGQFWESYEPQTFFTSNGLSAMGYGIPAAIAAKLHFPQRPVISVVGDGGLLMMQHNFVFMRQYDVPVVVVCFVDNSLSLIRLAQQRRGVETYGVDFPAPDFARVAEAHGITGVRASTIGELTRAVERALTSRAAAVIHVPVGIREYQAFC